MNEEEFINKLFELYSSFFNSLYSDLTEKFPEFSQMIEKRILVFNSVYTHIFIDFKDSKINFLLKKIMEDKSATFFINRTDVANALNDLISKIYSDMKEKLGSLKANEIMLGVIKKFEGENRKKVREIEIEESVNLFYFFPEWISKNIKKYGIEENIEDFFD